MNATEDNRPDWHVELSRLLRLFHYEERITGKHARALCAVLKRLDPGGKWTLAKAKVWIETSV